MRAGWFLSVVGAATLPAAVALVMAGPLQPPAGPIRPSYKTLSEVEPRTAVEHLPGSSNALYVISAPGSYHLTRPLVGVAGRSGIEINASDVTLDLGGFTLLGPGGLESGIRVTGSHSGIEVRNGVLRGWGLVAVDTSDATACRFRDLRLLENAAALLCAAGSIVSDCTAEHNSAAGLFAGQSSRVERSSSRFNGGHGIYVLEGSIVADCIVEGNAGDGIYLDGDGCLVSRCTAVGNHVNGVSSIYDSRIEHSMAEANLRNGFWGISTVTIAACQARGNELAGIVTQSGGQVLGCTVRDNRGDGIIVRDDCTVRGNNCTANGTVAGAAGVRVSGSNNRIQDNHIVRSPIGVKITEPRNFMAGNTVSDCPGGYDLVDGQIRGPILGGPELDSAPAWANFRF